MKKRIILLIAFLILCCGNAITVSAEEAEVYAEETASLYQCGSLEAETGISLYSLEIDDLKNQIYQDLSEVKTETDVSAYDGLQASEIKTAFEAVVNDHPELFYVSNKYQYSYFSSSGKITRIIWEYREDDLDIIGTMKDKLESRTNEILALTDQSMSDIEKLMTIHEALILNTTYGTQTEWQNGTGCYTAYCALTEGKAVCQGYTLAFHLLAKELGIQDVFVGSTELNHAWNYVILDGNGYHIDCTWDDKEGKNGEINHKNFLLSDEGIINTGHSVWDNSVYSGTDPFFDDYYWRDPFYSFAFIKHDGYWYQTDNVETGFSKLSGICSEGASILMSGEKNGVSSFLEICPEEQRKIGENILEPEYLTSMDSVEISAKQCVLYKGEEKKLSVNVFPQDASPDVQWKSRDESIATVSSDGRVKGVSTGSTKIYAVIDGVIRSCTVDIKAKPVSVFYKTHVQTYGWQDWVSDGEESGTTGLAKRLEGIQIKITGNTGLGIEYKTHVQTYGWQDWTADGEISGTTGQAKRLEAIKIRLTGADADDYDVYYRVHAQTYGWLGWAKNGESAGTAGLAKRLEAIEIKIVEKGAPAPGSTENCFVQSIPSVIYQTHVQSYGWQNWVSDGQISGTSGEAKRLEAIRITLEDSDISGGIIYQTHVQSYGWQDWVSDGQMAGTSGQAKRLEAVRIKLTGDLAEKYDIYYRVHVQSYGWLDWVKNGETAGTTGQAKRLEAIEIKLTAR